MSRPSKSGLDYFPLWKPHRVTENKFFNPDYKIRLNAIRNSSSGFIKKDDVREIILKDYKGRCTLCSGTEYLQVDHIVSVYQVAIGNFPIEQLNTRKNLQILCKKCNAGKAP